MSVRKGKFTIDDSPVYEGYTGGDSWNGFATPSFTLEQAHKVLTEMIGSRIAPGVFVQTLKGNEGNEWTYDPEKDEFKIYDYNYTEGKEPVGIDGVMIAKGEDFTTDTGEKVRLYDVTSGWCWDEETADLKKMLVMVTFPPCKKHGYKIPFPEMKKEPITEIQRDIYVMDLTDYEHANQWLHEYAGRRDAKFEISILVDNITENEIAKLKRSITKN